MVTPRVKTAQVSESLLTSQRSAKLLEQGTPALSLKQLWVPQRLNSTQLYYCDIIMMCKSVPGSLCPSCIFGWDTG